MFELWDFGEYDAEYCDSVEDELGVARGSEGKGVSVWEFLDLMRLMGDGIFGGLESSFEDLVDFSDVGDFWGLARISNT